MFASDKILEVKHLDQRDGLSHRNVWCTIEDKRGLIWIGTQFGLNRYDGEEFKWWNTNSHPKISSNNTTHLLLDNQDFIWMLDCGSRNNWQQVQSISLVHSITGKVSTLSDRFPEPLPFQLEDINSFLADDKGIIYFSLQDGSIYKLANNDRFVKLNQIAIPEIELGYVDKEENIWAFSPEQGIYHIDNNGAIACHYFDEETWNYEIIGYNDPNEIIIRANNSNKGIAFYTLDPTRKMPLQKNREILSEYLIYPRS